MLNIKTKAVAETGTLELLDADDEALFDNDIRCSITLYSPGSKTYEEADNERQNKILEIMQRRPGKAKLSNEERRQMDTTFYARVTASFNGWQYDESKSGFEEFKAAYLDRSIGFILDQVVKHLGEWGNFTRKSGTN